jgi:hypothetical protein
MPRAGLVGNPLPYEFFGTFAGLSFWPGSLTVLAAAPGVGKTSWLLRMVSEAAAEGFPTAIGCYEHSAAELKFRLHLQAQAALASPHAEAEEFAVETYLARFSQSVLLALVDPQDTIRGIEEVLLEDYGFPESGPALLAVDYLQRVPVVGPTGLVSEELRSGVVAAELRTLARRHGWAVIAACALRADHFADAPSLNALLGDERVAYESDRVLTARFIRPPTACGCGELAVHTLKDRAGPVRTIEFPFWGARLFPATDWDGAGCALRDIELALDEAEILR